MVNRFILSLILFFGTQPMIFGQSSKIFGVVTNSSGQPMELVNVTIKGKPIGTSTDASGNYELMLKPNVLYTVVASSVGYSEMEQQVSLKQGQRKEIDFELIPNSEEIDQVIVEDRKARKSTLTRLDPKLMTVLPETSGNFEAIIKTLPGVSSNNELSSQYSVRGGNFDENLVYVNDVQIYRPFLIRSGQQEGMSFINSDMVSSVLFSAGGFDAKYGDKMSSVLDIKYKKPTEFGGAFSASLMGLSATIMGDSKDHRFRHISGIRYKSNKYILNSLETKGDYNPQFLDFQTFLSYDITNRLELSFLGNYAKNNYTFIPSDRITKFGTFNQPLQLKIFFEGQEVDQFQTYTGALTLDFKTTDKLSLKLITSVFNTTEMETFDIESQYWINQVDNQLGSETLGDSIANIGVGTYLEHGRNFLSASVYSVEHKGMFAGDNNTWQWGVRYQYEDISDNLTEWMMVDSAGYSKPYTDSIVSVDYYIRTKNNLNSNRVSGYLQSTYSFELRRDAELSFTGGVRSNYWDFNHELVVSPRGNISLKPGWEKDFVFRFSTGYYYQPPFYKEMRNRDGEINRDIESQKSLHFVLGSDYNFRAWGRPFKLVTELYYKKLGNLITYTVDNVRVFYSGVNDAKGYARGLDLKINGEFVPGTESWFSMSWMKTEEDIQGDDHWATDDDGNEYWVEQGYLPRPSDQRFKFGVFFQDYFPGRPDYKMHLQINYGSKLKFGAPNTPRYTHTGDMKSYQRVDIGFSKVLKRKDKTYPKGHILYHVKDAWISAEIFNLMDRENTISHEWVSDYGGRQYAVENSLTGRRLNFKLSVRF